MEDNINKFRFIIPPVLFCTATLLLNSDLLFWLPIYFYPNSILNGFITLIGTSLIILTLGFIISSIGYCIVNLFGWTVALEDRKESKYSWKKSLSRETLWELAKKELGDWKSLKSDDNKYIRGQIDKRWQMFTANLNSCIAIIFPLIISSIFSFVCEYELWWFGFILFILLSVIFGFNSWRAYQSVHALTKAFRSP